jgi:hypothetical protein
MTSTSDSLSGLVEDMLQDAGCGQDGELRDALLSLGTLASLPVPAPSGELAALLEAGTPPANMPDSGDPVEAQLGDQLHEQAGEQPGDELARRRRRRHRPTALGLVLVAGMGLGVGGVAASSTAPENSAIEHLLEDWAPWNSPAAKATGPGYRGPAVAAAADLTDAASTGVPGGAADTANLAARLLRDPAGRSGRAALPPCAGPVKHDAGTSAKCGAVATGAAADGNGSGSKDSVRPPAAEGTQAGQGLPGAGKADAPALNTYGGPGATGAAAQKTDGSPGATQPAPGQSQSQGQPQGQPSGEGQGNGQKNPSPAK